MFDKLIVALDFSDLAKAEKIVKKVSPLVKTFKVGKELFTVSGPEAVHMIHSHKCRVFLDLKFHDIPHTVSLACEAAAKLGVFMMNVHVLGGKTMMRASAQAVRKMAAEKKIPPPKVIGVTILTSLTELDLKEIGIRKNMKQEVVDLALLAQRSGLDGVVASGQEIQPIRSVTGKNFMIVTPGVRPVWAAHGDQKRIVTPKKAVALGADYIVVGRPITQHPQPLIAVRKILKEIESH